ncbi:hypothetical protein KAX75_11275 [candidate division WOR-3 bacterium]|nr:hypothetical protein [candidate division WOR-3 bacterium]
MKQLDIRKEMKHKQHWLSFVDEKRKQNLLLILEELSSLVDKEIPDFVIIGAMSLLIQGYIGGYKVLWDVDLLFKNIDAIMNFRKREKSKNLRVVELDDGIIQNKNIGSLHSVWSFNTTWFNVDYIIKGNLFKFYNPMKRKKEPYCETVRFNKRNHYINLFLANPIDIFVEKIVTPRMEKELNLRDDFGVDIKHCLYILESYSEEDWFWREVKMAAIELKGKELLKDRLIQLLEIKDELGYDYIKLPSKTHDIINHL